MTDTLMAPSQHIPTRKRRSTTLESDRTTAPDESVLLCIELRNWQEYKNEQQRAMGRRVKLEYMNPYPIVCCACETRSNFTRSGRCNKCDHKTEFCAECTLNLAKARSWWEKR